MIIIPFQGQIYTANLQLPLPKTAPIFFPLKNCEINSACQKAFGAS